MIQYAMSPSLLMSLTAMVLIIKNKCVIVFHKLRFQQPIICSVIFRNASLEHRRSALATLVLSLHGFTSYQLVVFVRRAGLLWSQQDFEWR